MQLDNHQLASLVHRDKFDVVSPEGGLFAVVDFKKHWFTLWRMLHRVTVSCVVWKGLWCIVDGNARIAKLGSWSASIPCRRMKGLKSSACMDLLSGHLETVTIWSVSG